MPLEALSKPLRKTGQSSTSALVCRRARVYPHGELLGRLQLEAEGRLKNQPDIAKEYFEKLKAKARSLEVGDWLLTLLGPEF
jgi:hypothetical protein